MSAWNHSTSTWATARPPVTGDGALAGDSTTAVGNAFDGSDGVTTIVGAGTGVRCGTDPVTNDDGQFGSVGGYPGVAGDDMHGSTLIIGQSDGVDGKGVSAPGNLGVDDNGPRGVDNDASGQGYGHGSGNTANSDRNQPIGRESRWPSGQRGVGDWSRRYTGGQRSDGEPRRLAIGYDGDQWSGRQRRPGSFESTPKKIRFLKLVTSRMRLHEIR